MTTCVVIMAGLPGTGKSTLAKLLAAELHGVVLDKDVIRAGLFPAPWIEYSREQDDFCFEVLLNVGAYLIKKDKPPDFLFIDGRPFARQDQLQQVINWASGLGCHTRIIHTQCSDQTAKRRLAQPHIARNRNYDMYLKLKANFEEIGDEKLIIDTDQPLELSLQKCLAYLPNQL